VLALSSAQVAVAETPLRVFISWPNSPPLEPVYSWNEKEQNFNGIDPEVLSLLLNDLEREYKFVFPRIRSRTPRLDVLINDLADISINCFSITKDRMELIDFSRPYFTDGISAMVRADSPVNSLADLEDKKVLALLNTTAFRFIREHAPKSRILADLPPGVSSPTQAVLSGAADAFFLDKSYLDREVKGVPGLRVWDGVLTEEHWGIGVQKGSTELLKQLNSALKKRIDDGSIRAIFMKHGIHWQVKNNMEE
jgi:polar amino acid transport system substrate-binding protein